MAAQVPRSKANSERLRRRRRFALRLVPLAGGLLAVGLTFAGDGGLAGGLGIVALGQGIGLSVALIWLLVGYNPLTRD